MPFDDLIAATFQPDHERRVPWLAPLWLAVAFAGGLAAWAYILGWGLVPLNFHDWTDINLPRLMFLQNALQAGDWPLHMGNAEALHGVTDRFLALPDVVTTPQALLLLLVNVQTFVLLDVLIHYAIGFAGVWLLRRRFDWSLFTVTVVFLLFLFNGHILAHYTVGHFTWGPYFLFPVVLLLLFRFLDGDDSWRLLGTLAAVLFYMVLAGGQHHMTWIVLFLLLLAPFCGRRAWWPLAAIAASGLLSAVRLLPPALQLSSFRDAGLIADVIGYPSLTHLLGAMVVLRREHPAFDPALPGNIWFFDSAYYEFNVYVGIVGASIIGVFGVYHWLRDERPRYWQLIVPVFAMTALSMGTAYRIVRATAIPLFQSERYTGRLFSLALVVLIVMAAIHLDRHMRAVTARGHRVLALVALAFLALDVSANIRLSRVAISSGLFGPRPMDQAATAVAHRSDPEYVTMLLIGVAVTGMAALTLAVLAARERGVTTRPTTQ
jgi:hypothetical protein